jgi:hypothetical protein
MTVGQMGMKHPSLAAMVDAIQWPITREALHGRFTQKAEAFLEKCLQHVLITEAGSGLFLEANVVKRFNRIMIFDSSSWDVDPKLADVLPGTGGGASAANCKLQACYEYTHGELGFFQIGPGTRPDNGYTDTLPSLLRAGDLALFDQGYFKLETLSQMAKKDAYFLTRFPVKTLIRDAQTRVSIDLQSVLSRFDGNACQFNVVIGGHKEQAEIVCRLICQRVSEKIANERRRRHLKEMRRKGRTPSNARLALCDWTLLITNAPDNALPDKIAWQFYSLRWQIELIFKQLKSVLALHKSNTRNISRLKCEIYGKLILAVLIHRMHAGINNLFWQSFQRELSFDKFYKRIQERAFTILRLALVSPRKAIDFFASEIPQLLFNCLKSTQPSRKTSLEKLVEGYT